MWIQEKAEIEVGVDSKCAPEEEGENLKVKVTSQVVREGLVLDREGRPTNVINPKLEWDRGENEASENNVKVMYSIFNAISTNEFHRIATCTSAKKVWDILQVTHEGTNIVKMFNLQMLTSSFNLSEPISNSKVVRKILGSLLERFRAKVTAIEESKHVDSLKIDELVGSFQTFEMTLESLRKAKGIALKVIREESLSSKSEDDEKMSESSSELSEQSDFNDDDMSFDTTYETWYKECLSLKQEQVKWKTSKKILTNEFDILMG
ncbi:hypothetical protein CK203_099972 [Vitis vinifera]|uniref:Gag-pol polyprotein n=1 Tax=Vitis vinifera TaxID=29760 RepID=A0A438CIP9_VITVI|nr:hypothetical protein CK203_099972 [Vitis vinifera]